MIISSDEPEEYFSLRKFSSFLQELYLFYIGGLTGWAAYLFSEPLEICLAVHASVLDRGYLIRVNINAH
jgi:hypothetical protein